MQLQDHVRSAWARLPLILALTALIALLGTLGGSEEVGHKVEVQVLYSLEQVPNTADVVANATTQLRSLAAVVSSPEVLQPVIDDLSLNKSVAALAEDVNASATAGTYILTVTASADTPEGAEQLAGAVAKSLVATGQGITTPGLQEVAQLTPQALTSTASNMHSTLSIVKNVIIGIVLGMGLSLIIDLIDPRIRWRSQFTQMTAAPLLAELSPRSETQYPSLASQLILKAPNVDRRIVVVLPSGHGLAHLEVAASLSRELAPLSSATLLISPEGPNETGGPVTTKSIDLAFPAHEPGTLQERLSVLAEEFDSVVIAAPDIDMSALSTLLARFADTSVLVVDRSRDTKGAVARRLAALRELPSGALAAVLVTPSRRIARPRK